jgi:hypothetical protein
MTGLKAAAVALVTACALAGAAHATRTTAGCTPGTKTVGRQTVVVFCGPAHATVRYAGRTIVYRNGACHVARGTFTLNLGASVPGALTQRFPYFGLTVEGTRPGTYTRQNLSFADRGTIYAIGRHTVVLKPGLRAGTFTGTAFPGLRPVSGSFSC